MGQTLEKAVEISGVEMVLGPLPQGVYGEYRGALNVLVVSQSIVSDDRRAIAATLAHELTHTAQRWTGDARSRDCVRHEVEAFSVQANLWYSYWRSPGRTYFPTPKTRLQAHHNEVTTIWATEGEPGLYAAVAGSTGYQDQCNLWLP
jgi:hypothetical protein